MNDDPTRVMWSQACEMLARGDRMQRQFFQPMRAYARQPVWEPPADVFEDERGVLVVVALPGVKAEQVEVAIDGNDLVVIGVRTPPAEFRTAAIHRLELPQGRFERRLRLPAGRYSDVRRSLADGCLLVLLSKVGPDRD